MGEPDHGHTSLSSSCNRNANAGPPAEEALWSHKTPHFQDHDEEHSWPSHLSINRSLCSTFWR